MIIALARCVCLSSNSSNYTLGYLLMNDITTNRYAENLQD